MALATWKDLCIDASDARRLGAFWEVFGATVTPSDDTTWFSLEGIPGTPFEGVSFVPVPEPKTAKNRVHWDVTGSVPALLDAGARLLRPATDGPEPDRTWDVLADPESNEFCVFGS